MRSKEKRCISQFFIDFYKTMPFNILIKVKLRPKATNSKKQEFIKEET